MASLNDCRRSHTLALHQDRRTNFLWLRKWPTVAFTIFSLYPMHVRCRQVSGHDSRSVRPSLFRLSSVRIHKRRGWCSLYKGGPRRGVAGASREKEEDMQDEYPSSSSSPSLCGFITKQSSLLLPLPSSSSSSFIPPSPSVKRS